MLAQDVIVENLKLIHETEKRKSAKKNLNTALCSAMKHKEERQVI